MIEPARRTAISLFAIVVCLSASAAWAQIDPLIRGTPLVAPVTNDKVPEELVVIHDPHEPTGIAEPGLAKFLWPTKDAFQDPTNKGWEQTALPDDDMQKWIDWMMGTSAPAGKDRTLYVETPAIRYIPVSSADRRWLLKLENFPIKKRPPLDPDRLQVLESRDYSTADLEGLVNNLARQPLAGDATSKDVPLVQSVIQSSPLSNRIKALDWRLRSYSLDRKWQAVTVSFEPAESKAGLQLEVTIGPSGSLIQMAGAGLLRGYSGPPDNPIVPMTRPSISNGPRSN
jgi:hypothetical protein